MLDAAWFAYVAVLGVLAVYGGHRLYLTALALRAGVRVADGSRAGDVAVASPRDRASSGSRDASLPVVPVVTVQLPLYNERYVAERVIDAAAALAWPADRLEIQVLDDSTDDCAALCERKVAALRARGVDIAHVRRPDRAGFKAGALSRGLEAARGELVLVLDADFVPPPDLLRSVVGHFDDPGVGMVQVRWEHLNPGASALTRVQALLLDGHFAIEQLARSGAGRFFNFNGTAGVWRRAAIDDAGGWHGDTLTEDLDLSYRALLRGWRFVYVPGRSAPAELPAAMRAFKSQQYRWAKGSVQVARKLLPAVLRARLPRAVKLEALFHLTQNVPYLLTLFLVLLIVPALVLRPGTRAEMWFVHVPALIATALTLGAYVAVSQRLLGRDRGGVSRARGVRAVVGSLLRLPALIAVTIAVTAGICVSQARAVIEGALGHDSEFVRTPKQGHARDVAEPAPAAKRAWRRRYSGIRDLTPLAELALAVFFAAFTLYACDVGRWSAIPACAVLAAGFGYVGIRSLVDD